MIRKILRHPVLILMFLNCVIHQYLARTQNLDVWLGGGFGMFSGVNFVDGRTIICRAKLINGEEHLCFLSGTDSTIFSKFQILPSQFFFEKMKLEINSRSFNRNEFGYKIGNILASSKQENEIKSFRIELWEKTYDPVNYTFGTHQISTFEFEKSN